MRQQPWHVDPAPASSSGGNGNGGEGSDRSTRSAGREAEERSMTELLYGLARSVTEAQRELELDHAEYEVAEAIIDVKLSLRMREVDEPDSSGGRHTRTRVFGSIVTPGSGAAVDGGDDTAAGVRLVLRPSAAATTAEWPAEQAVRAGWS